jgi:hypothetical protein
LLDDPISEPELMYLACDHICISIAEVVRTCGTVPLIAAREFAHAQPTRGVGDDDCG